MKEKIIDLWTSGQIENKKLAILNVVNGNVDYKWALYRLFYFALADLDEEIEYEDCFEPHIYWGGKVYNIISNVNGIKLFDYESHVGFDSICIEWFYWSVHICLNKKDYPECTFEFDVDCKNDILLVKKAISLMRSLVRNGMSAKYEKNLFRRLQVIRKNLIDNVLSMQFAWTLHDLINNPKHKAQWYRVFSFLL